MDASSRNKKKQVEQWLSEKCSGNQNMLHLCAANLAPVASNGMSMIFSISVFHFFLYHIFSCLIPLMRVAPQ